MAHEGILSSTRTFDFEIQGIVGIRLVNATTGDATGFARQLGQYQASLAREPDIIIRFERELAPSKLKYLGLNWAGFTDEGFYVLGRKDGEVRARIPFNDIGNQCEIVCQSGLGSVPLLFDIIRMVFLRENFVPVHGSAFLYEGNGILVVAWAKGGKTETLLAFAERGAQYVGDEWVMLSSDGQAMFGIPVPVTIWDWQFRYIPNLLPRIGTKKQLLFKTIHWLDRIHGTLGPGKLGQVFPLEILGRALPLLKQKLSISLLPRGLFGDRVCQGNAALDMVFLPMSQSEPGISVVPCDPVEAARRMASSNEYEHTFLFQYYRAFRFAFPHLRNKFMEESAELQRSLLCRSLASKEAYMVMHPYPVSLDELFEKMRPYCAAGRSGTSGSFRIGPDLNGREGC
jgi:hypothetical protein